MLPSPFYPAGSYSNGDGFSWPTADDDLAGSGGDVLSGQAPHPGADQTAYGYPANDPAGTAPNGLNNLSHAAQTLADGGNGDPANRGHDRPDDDGQEGEEDRAKRRRI